MAEQNKNNRPPQDPFDQLMFGQPRGNSDTKDTTGQPDKQSANNSFDMFQTAQTMVETYKQLSPYIKNISGLVKKYKS